MVSPYSLSRPGGVQGQVLGLSRALRARGHEVAVVGPVDDEEAVPGPPGEHHVIGRVTDVRANGSVAPVALSPAASLDAARYVRRGGFDVAHVHEPFAPVASYALLVAHPVPLVATYHRAGVSRWAAFVGPLGKLVSRRFEVQVAVSEAARRTAARSSAGTIEVLFNGVDVERFASAEPCRDEAGRPVVLFVGRHEARKGLEVLLDAFAAVQRPAVLWIGGDGSGSAAPRRRYPPSDRVRWLGRLSDEEVASRLAGADVLCVPSLGGESFGVVLLEGMAAGCAVVASDLEGYRAAAGGHAVLVPPGDVGALSLALEAALADAVEGAGRSSPAARRAATEHARGWSMDALAERYLDVYQQALRSSDQRRRTP